MSLLHFILIFAFCAVLAQVSAIWLIIHGRSVARAMESKPGIAAPVRGSVSPNMIWVAIGLFNLAWIASIAMLFAIL